MLLIDAIIVIFLGFCLGLITYMVMLMKRLIDDADTVRQHRISENKDLILHLEQGESKIAPNPGLSPSTLAANKKVKLPRPPLPPPPRPATLAETIEWE